ncbi:ATP-binding protein [Actinomadura gamaensis]|uniref:histidine kinase n=1 Tax=Actinomadura gamaensis TaxID=1763541 RepID=A0ABV9UCF2_9ACTN
MPERSHTVSFRPRARLVSVLGEHLISDPAVGLVELVKNAYDADASEVTVELSDLGDPEATSVIVTDNGTGMTLDDLVTKWLSPAMDHKESAKRRGARTAKGRLPIGEKGVGRFAVHHLGRRLRLITRAVDGDELTLDIDWDRFDQSEDYLDGLELSVHQRPPQLFTGDSTGTRLEVTLPRAPWTEKLVRKLHRTLKRLQSPVHEGETDFNVRLCCPEFPDLQDVSPTDILNQAHYEFRALIEPDGRCDFEYVCKHPVLSRRTRTGTETLSTEISVDGAFAECGPFWLNLYVWDRSSNFLQATGTSSRELNAHSGVSLFRDGLRVLPYGEPGDDWLFLDQERVQAPAERIGNNQVIGLVSVDQSSNLQLRDKTNREGLIENQAFQDLRTLLRAAIKLFVTHWRHDRPSKADRRVKSGTSSDLGTARALASEIEKTASNEIKVHRPETAPTHLQETPANDSAPEEKAVSQRQAVKELMDELASVSEAMDEERRRRDVLRQLAATGLAAERVVHEFGRQVGGAMAQMEQLERGPRTGQSTTEALNALGVALRTLRSEFRVLAPYETAGRADRMRTTSMLDAARLAVTLNQHALASSGVHASVTGQDFRARSRPAAVAQILDNLIHNASHWAAIGPSPERRVEVVLRPASSQIVVADSGPGVHPEMHDQLFDPFTTLKVEGTGLGLFISAQLADSLGCDLRLAYEDERPEGTSGAAMVLQFPIERDNGENGSR